MSPAGPARPGVSRPIVVLCSDLADTPLLPEPRRLALAIRDRDDVDVVTLGRVCAQPAPLLACAGASAAVVVCRDGHERREELITWLHEAGLRFDVVDVVAAASMPDALRTDARAALLRAVHAAIVGARVEPYPMVSAERPAGGVRHTARRSPLAATAARLPMPTLSRAACTAATGCDICVSRCPPHALAMTVDGPEVDPAACTGCGACVAVCPTDAWRLAGSSERQLTARLAALLDPPGLPAADGIVFRCVHAPARPPAAGSAELVVPSLLAIGTGVILHALLAGARAVHLAGCDQAECRQAGQQLTELANTLLRATGHPAAVTCTPTPQPRPAHSPDRRRRTVRTGVREPAATVTALHALPGTKPVRVVSTVAPLGAVRVDPSLCTGCEACVSSCPATAVTASSDGVWVLRYDPRRCIGCDVCARTCPEHAITVERVIDTTLLADDDVVLCRIEQQPCPTCGRPVQDLPVRRAAAARLAAAAPASASLTAATCGHCGPADVGIDLPTRQAPSATSRRGPR